MNCNLVNINSKYFKITSPCSLLPTATATAAALPLLLLSNNRSATSRVYNHLKGFLLYALISLLLAPYFLPCPSSLVPLP